MVLHLGATSERYASTFLSFIIAITATSLFILSLSAIPASSLCPPSTRIPPTKLCLAESFGFSALMLIESSSKTACAHAISFLRKLPVSSTFISLELFLLQTFSMIFSHLGLG